MAIVVPDLIPHKNHSEEIKNLCPRISSKSPGVYFGGTGIR